MNDFIDIKTNTLYRARLSKFATEGERPSNFFCSLMVPKLSRILLRTVDLYLYYYLVKSYCILYV